MVEDIWYGGLDPEMDYVLPDAPGDPEMREGVSLWLFEENGEFALPRVGLDAVGGQWNSRRCDMNVAFGDGRVLRQSKHMPAVSPKGADGRDRVLGAGSLRFECLEPFRKWRVSFEEELYEGSVEEQIRGDFRLFADNAPDVSHALVPVKFEAELTMAAPAWTQDYRGDALDRLSEGDRIDAGLMGYGWRIEQTFNAVGELVVGGEARGFKATGDRIHRQSVRPMGAFRGHCWQAANFPDGRAFGLCIYPPREDGSTYNIGYICQDGRMYPAKARGDQAAWLRKIMPSGDDVAVELESELGITRIEGVTALSTFHMANPGMKGMNNQQGGVRYTWDGVSAYGMIERSSPAELCEVQA